MRAEDLKDPRDRANAERSERRNRAATYTHKNSFDEQHFREDMKYLKDWETHKDTNRAPRPPWREQYRAEFADDELPRNKQKN